MAAISGTASGTFSRADLQRAIQEKEEEIRQKTLELKELKELLQCLTPDEDDADDCSEPIIAASDVFRRVKGENFDQAEALVPLITPPPSRSVTGPSSRSSSVSHEIPSATPPPASFDRGSAATEYTTAQTRKPEPFGRVSSDGSARGASEGVVRVASEGRQLRPPPLQASIDRAGSEPTHAQAWAASNASSTVSSLRKGSTSSAEPSSGASSRRISEAGAGPAAGRKLSTETGGGRKLSTESAESEAYKGTATLFQEMGAAWREREAQALMAEQGQEAGGYREAHTWMSPEKAERDRDDEFGVPAMQRSLSFANAKDTPESPTEAPPPKMTAAAAAAAAAAEGEGNAKPAGRKPPALNVMPAGAGRGRGRGGDDDEDGSDTLVAGPAKSGSHSNKDTLSLYEFKVKVEQHKKVEYLVLDIRDNLNVFRQALSEQGLEFEDGKGDEIWSAQIHCLNANGDVRALVSEDVFDEVKEEYLQSEGHVSLQPLHMICLEKDQDILSLVKIPPHKGSDKPMAWKQGKMLGQGAFGSVYMAMKGDGEIIAVKRIEIPAGGTEIIDSFQTESQLLERLEHPNIVRYISSKVVSKSLAVIWIEYVPGGSVANILQVFGAISEDLVRRYLQQILQGLVYLHANSVIHRDLKPGNILVAVDGVVKLSDFGASMSVSASITSQQQFGFAGTPNYIAPEMLRSRGPGVYSYNIDVWSLGMTVIEMLTAAMPFEEFTNPFAVMFQIAKLEEPPVIPDYFSEDAKSFLQKCLDPNPDTRPQAKHIINHPFVTGHDSSAEVQPSVPRTPGNKLKRSKGLRRSSISEDEEGSSIDPEKRESFSDEEQGGYRGRKKKIDSGESDAGHTSEEDERRLSENTPTHRRMSSCELPYGISMDAMESHGIEECMRSSVQASSPSNPGGAAYLMRSPRSPEAARQPVYLHSAMNSSSATSAQTFIATSKPGGMSSMPPPPHNSKESDDGKNASSHEPNVNIPPQRPLPVPPPNKPPATRAGGNANGLPKPPAQGKHASTFSAIPQSRGEPVNKTARHLAPPPPIQVPLDPGDVGKLIAWQYYHHSRWRPFDAKASSELEEAFQAKKDKTVITLSTDSRWGTQYSIDFKALQQTNMASGFIRPIRRLTQEDNAEVDAKAMSGMSRRKSQGPFMWAGLSPSNGGGVNVGILPTTNEQLSHFLRQKASVESEEIRGLKDSFKVYARKALWKERQHKYQERVNELEKQVTTMTEQIARTKSTSDKTALEKTLKATLADLEKEKEKMERAKRELESPQHRRESTPRVGGGSTSGDERARRRSSGAELKKLEENKVTRKDLKFPWMASRNFHLPLHPHASRSASNSLPGSSIQSIRELTAEMLETAQLVPAAMLLPGGLYEGWPAITGLYVGNTYNGTVLHTGSAGEPDTRQGMKDVLLHSWTMYVRQSEGRPLEIVRKVCFTIWPLKANQATMELRSEPFEVTRCSSAPFDVGVDIHLNKGKKVFKLQHFLCLTMSGGWSDDRNSTESDCFPVTHYAICIKPPTAGFSARPS
mmetsp:Transcript_58469/g.137298  ORF Transcript_58469/g.137298 Transcript_58469/m.137298 type:complete len:1524 (+) Transcript_58469:381-4952(+)